MSHTNEDRAYAVASLGAGCTVGAFKRTNGTEGFSVGIPYGVSSLGDTLRRPFPPGKCDDTLATTLAALAAAGRALGLHDQAKAILNEMTSAWAVMDQNGRVLAAEGYLLIPRDVAEEAIKVCDMHINLAKIACQVDVTTIVKDTKTALADALGKKEGNSDERRSRLPAP